MSKGKTMIRRRGNLQGPRNTMAKGLDKLEKENQREKGVISTILVLKGKGKMSKGKIKSTI